MEWKIPHHTYMNIAHVELQLIASRPCNVFASSVDLRFEWAGLDSRNGFLYRLFQGHQIRTSYINLYIPTLSGQCKVRLKDTQRIAFSGSLSKAGNQLRISNKHMKKFLNFTFSTLSNSSICLFKLLDCKFVYCSECWDSQ